MMLQHGKDGNFKHVGFFCRQTSETESKWHSYELETLTVVETLKRYLTYLMGLHFKVVTDCSAIKCAANKKELVPKIARWWLQLQEFSFEVQHRAGAQMAHIDALSRNAVADQPVSEKTDMFVLRMIINGRIR